MTQPTSERDPRQAAQQYQTEQRGEAVPEQSRPKTETEWRDIISMRIEEAMRNGDFDNLAGRGKPLKLDRNPYTPAGMEMAFDLLKNNDLAPAWIGMRRELLRDIEHWRSQLAALVQRYGAEHAARGVESNGAVQARWLAQRQALQLEVDAFNRRIVNLNLQQPIAHLELLRLVLADELQAAGAGSWEPR